MLQSKGYKVTEEECLFNLGFAYCRTTTKNHTHSLALALSVCLSLRPQVFFPIIYQQEKEIDYLKSLLPCFSQIEISTLALTELLSLIQACSRWILCVRFKKEEG